MFVNDAGATIRDLRLAATGGEALAMYAGGTALRVYATSTGPSDSACLLRGTSTLTDTVCAGGRTGTLLSAGGSVQSWMATFRNVTTVGGVYGIEALAQASGQVSVDAVNVIAQGSTSDLWAYADAGSTAALVLSHSNFTTTTSVGGGTSISSPSVNGNVGAVPRFADAASGDFHELAGSPTVDAGIDQPDIGLYDLDGKSRRRAGVPACTEPQSGPPDIGAYEYAPSPLPASSCSKPPPPPSNAFSFRLKGKKKLLVDVAAAGTVAVAPAASKHGKRRRRLLRRSSATGGPGRLVVTLELTRHARAVVHRRGKVKIPVSITFAPDGGTARTESTKLTIKRRHRK